MELESAVRQIKQETVTRAHKAEASLRDRESPTRIVFSGEDAFPVEQLATEAQQLELRFITPPVFERLQQQAIAFADYVLYRQQGGLELRICQSKLKPLSVDFLAGKNHHRRLYGGGKGQALAKAIGLKKYRQPYVLDATAGLGRDAFVLASLGCHVTLLERSKIVHALLQDGLQRALQYTFTADNTDKNLSVIMARMHLLRADSHCYLKAIDKENKQPDIIYLDPMFPSRDKSAQVKKEMALFHKLVGTDEDSYALLALACQHAKYRVVVKRPAKAECLAARKADFSFPGKSTRYDVYLPDST